LETLQLGRKGLPTEAQIRRFGELLLKGDALADALAEHFGAVGFARARADLDRALHEGIEAVPGAPAPLRELVAQCETDPFWLDRDLLEEGARACRRTGPFGVLIMRDVALMGGYGNAAINKPLTFTGALTEGAARRTVETASFWIDVTRERGLEKGGVGFQSAVKVRMMHGLLRRRIAAHPQWRTDLWGVPINQADMIATNLAFSLIFLHGLRCMGVQFTRRERAGILHLWRYVGYLMGIDERYLASDEKEGFRLLYLSLLTQPDADEDTRALSRALMNEPYDMAGGTRWGDALAEVMLRCHNGMTHVALGDRAYANLGLPVDRRFSWYPFAVAPAIFGTELLRLAVPGGTTLYTWVGGRMQEVVRLRNLRRKPPEFKPVETLARDRAA